MSPARMHSVPRVVFQSFPVSISFCKASAKVNAPAASDNLRRNSQSRTAREFGAHQQYLGTGDATTKHCCKNIDRVRRSGSCRRYPSPSALSLNVPSRPMRGTARQPAGRGSIVFESPPHQCRIFTVVCAIEGR